MIKAITARLPRVPRPRVRIPLPHVGLPSFLDRRLQGVRALEPPIDLDGPRVRLGVAWAIATLVALVVGPIAAGALFAIAALPAAGQVARSWRGKRERPHRLVAALGAPVLPLAAMIGPAAVGVAAVAIVVAAVASGRDWRTTAAVPLVVGLALASPVVVRDRLGFSAALVLVLFAHAHDASSFLVGSGSSHRWEGPVAGAASLAAVSLLVAAILVPPFRGSSPWTLAAVAAVLAPVGRYLGTALLGDREDRAPGLRRVDSLLVLGPPWALLAAVLLEP